MEISPRLYHYQLNALLPEGAIGEIPTHRATLSQKLSSFLQGLFPDEEDGAFPWRKVGKFPISLPRDLCHPETHLSLAPGTFSLEDGGKKWTNWN